MRCGHTWGRKRINNGFGLQLTRQHEKLLGYILAIAKHQSAKQLWQSLPPVYRQCAICYTDFWEAYEQILPSTRHKAVAKDSGKTSYIERFNNTLRQRVGRLVRKTLSFSKMLDNHIGEVWYFVHYYNASLRS
jgi:IS1 family transposase